MRIDWKGLLLLKIILQQKILFFPLNMLGKEKDC